MEKRFTSFTVLISILSVFLSSCSMLQNVRKNRPRETLKKSVPMKVREGFDMPRKRIMLLPFIDMKPTRSTKVANTARKSVIQSLNQTGQFVVIRNEDFPQDLNRFKNQNTYNLANISKIANGIGIAAIVEGTILEIKARRISDQVGLFRKIRARMEAKVRIRAFAAKTGREILNDIRSAEVTAETTQVGKYQSSDRFLEEDPKLIQEVTQKAFRGTMGIIVSALDKLNWEGRIALVKGERIYLNAGRLSGLQVGDILKVMDKGEEVFDPETGSLIGHVEGRMKGTIEVVSYFGKDGAIGIIHSGSGFEENDKVELY